MTNEEAIISMKEMRESLEQIYESRLMNGRGQNKAVEGELEALDLAIEALEKQIPKKPIETTRRTAVDKYGFVNVNEFECPCCESRILYRQEVKRCLECGQRIDWSDEYETINT